MNFKEYDLSNGLKIMLVPMDGASTFTHICLMNGGSRYETAKVSGISHMLEHMMFKGTKKRRSAKDISIELETMGAINNAFTSEETIGYWVNAPREAFFQVADILSDQLINSVLDSEELEREKNAVIEEMNMRNSDPMTSVFDMLTPLIYGDQAAGRDVIGTKETVLSLSRRQLRRYMDKYTVTNNMVVVVAGAIPSGAQQAMEEYYCRVPTGEVPRKYQLKPSRQVEAEVIVRSLDLPQTSFALAVRGPSVSSKDKYALKVLEAILGRGMSSRLFLEVRERRGLAYSVGAMSDLQSDTGNFFVYAGVSPNNLHKALTVIKEELIKIAQEVPSEQEMLKVNNMIRAGTTRTMEDTMRVALGTANDLLTLDEVVHPNSEIKKINAVTPEEVRALAEKMFVNKNLNLAVVGPHSSNDLEELKEVISF